MFRSNRHLARRLPRHLPRLVTVTVAVPLWVLSMAEVAFTVRLVAVSSSATVSVPSAAITVSVFAPPVTVQFTTLSSSSSFVPGTVAVNCCEPPLATLTDEGATVTPVTTGISAGFFTAMLKSAVKGAVGVAPLPNSIPNNLRKGERLCNNLCWVYRFFSHLLRNFP